MFIAKWNRSVILTYIGLMASVIGIYCITTMENSVKYAMICFMIAGVCDMFDGYIARKCKRTEEEKEFGVQLDSLVDVVSFVVLPIVLMIGMGLTKWYHVVIECIYAICGIARLAYFNIFSADSSKPIEFYTGLPVTVIALLFPFVYLIHLVVATITYQWICTIFVLTTAILFISKIKIKKAKGIAYVCFALLAVIMVTVYVFCL